MADRPIANIADNPEWVAEAANWFSAKWDIPATAYAESMKESIAAQGRTVPQWFIVRGGESVEIRKVNAKGDPELLGSLVSLWRKSVEATHTFLTNDDIERIAGYVPQAIENVRQLTVAADTRGTLLGFIGVDGDTIEMLFVHPEARGKGGGQAPAEPCRERLRCEQGRRERAERAGARLLRTYGLQSDWPFGNRRRGRRLPHPAHAARAIIPVPLTRKAVQPTHPLRALSPSHTRTRRARPSPHAASWR